ncbi:MAG TPA: aminotransferase class V-fold PLP-dependent enzyme [Terriglobia bacterium]|nr:aminotransferase class V-fold PLP-dependent enzyme [Terriglobia bacterium]
MSIDLSLYRQEFPVTCSAIYLNHAAVSPVSCRVRDAMTNLIEDVCRFGGNHWERWLDAYEAIRAKVASFLNAAPEEIAFIKNTSEGISLFANGLDWKDGDEVVSIAPEFPANYYPWKYLERKGVRLRLVPERDGVITVEDIAAALRPNTRVVAVSFVQFLSGCRLDLERLGKVCQERGALLFVDAIQGLGAFPIDVKRANIAALAADGHKWLMGPEGSGLFYIRRDLIERIQPSSVGWMSVKAAEDFSSRKLEWAEGARRFECGTLNTAGVYGLGAALDLLQEVGAEPIARRILSLTGRLREGLRQKGHRVFGPSVPEQCSGIVSFTPADVDPAEMVRRLSSRGVSVAARCGKVRISPHFYNTEEEIDRALALL